MPIISSIEHTLSLADVGTRVRISVTTPGSPPLTIVVPTEAAQAWPDGAWIEVVYLGGTIDTVMLASEFGVTLNLVSNSAVLEAGQHARFSKVSGVSDTWDVTVFTPLPSTGAAGQVLKSVGFGSQGYWANPDQVPAPAIVYRLTGSSTGTFGGSVFNSWSVQQIDQNYQNYQSGPPAVTWNAGLNSFEFVDPYMNGGMWEVSIDGHLTTSGNFPNGVITYGVAVNPNNGAQNKSYNEAIFSRYNETSPIPFGVQGSANAPSFGSGYANSQSFFSRHLVTVSGSPTSSISPEAFAYAYNNTSDEWSVSLIMTFKRLGDFTDS